MWHDFLVLPPLLCFMFATWGIWEPEADPHFGWMLAGLGLQLAYVADRVLTGAGWFSIGLGLLTAAAFVYCLKRTIAVEQSSKRLRELRDEE